ncbi:MAG: hypothetical protein HN729_03930 [Candidatus Marinimicrobia bacterium]|jgi:ATP-dependent DNA helicase RecG|nr:hypothetical protein [Candidatus Neomarinimicrobiota bacterium]MBT3635178.1 hypothetical protein [Candidatus Neomarinimicrobiota bacterium]MBT3683937.1 hypothetical protein [Candidatus Neomarinimicrobiota bacterium]MBT3760863.1 hypothetical protein [Candidatus Neomarinimicrobiota bacterium]MBT3896907.1 hypothetical protein [Candidatus Neomarinimicrobiota bacterium]
MSENDNNYKPGLAEFNDWISETVRFRDSENVKISRSTKHIDSVLEDICAFANSGQGIVYFGVDESGIVIGDDMDLEKIRSVMLEIFIRISPSLFPRIIVKQYDGKSVLGLDIINAPDKPYFFDGKYFKRMGTSNMSLFPHEIKIFMDQKHSPKYFDTDIVSGYHGGVNQERLDWYIDQADIQDNLGSDNKPDDRGQMLKLGLLTENRMNSAAVLCFGIDLKEVFSHAKIICQVVDGFDEDGTVLLEDNIDGDIFTQLESVERFLENKMPDIIHGYDDDREKVEFLVLLAVEAITIAIVHRDYSLKDPIGMLLFNDRIEIYIPGNLSKWLPDKKVRSDQVVIPPNPIMAKLFYLAGLTEDWLPSMDKFEKIMDELNLPIPEYINDDKYLGLVLRWKKATEEYLQKKKKEAQVYSHQPIQAPSPTFTADYAMPEYRQTLSHSDTYTHRVLAFCTMPRPRMEIQYLLQLRDRKHFREAILKPLLTAGLLKMTIPRKPNSPKQQYVITAKGDRWLDVRNIPE